MNANNFSSNTIRQTFLDFFRNKQHKIVSSVPIVVKDDPTLMFINAGMNPFKDYFLGNAKPVAPRIADSQKCLRVSGKHNDLEEVGVDTYHHTLFEMLGNWSFGDYFKAEAISWAWELLTEVFKMDPDRLYVTVFEGDDKEGLERDTESAQYWKQFVPENRILNGNKKDNFWEMGDTGPCGPCSEIHVDIRSEAERARVNGADLVNADHPHVIEIWNLVFMQFNRKADGSLENLPQTHVDTGMGFERLCMVLQEKDSSYDTDVFQPIIQIIAKISGIQYGDDERTDIAMRVIADHLRAVSFAIADGQLPSNNGAGYVIRRILRRAVRYAYSVLNIDRPVLAELLPTLVTQMGDFFPELVKQQKLISQVITEEELAFIRTLELGLQRLEEHLGENLDVLPGKIAFELYDTFGFPLDLTALILRERGKSVDEKGFAEEMQKQKDRSRAAGKLSVDDWIVKREGQGVFVGYDQLQVVESTICRYRKVEEKKKSFYQIVLDKTPFYPEGGGQIGDCGWLIDARGEKVRVWNTRKESGLILHFVNTLPFGEVVIAQVDEDARKRTTANHSATHLLHHALREILGTHVEQKGSFVGPEYLRFDFSHFSKVQPDELSKIEARVNALIDEQIPLGEFRNISMEEATAKGALALFGEKYGEVVRAIQFGDSVELCGGTHLNNTAYIGMFVITGESSVAAGIRRIEAISGAAVRSLFHQQREEIQTIKTITGNQKSPSEAVEMLKSELAETKEKLTVFEKEKNKAQVVEMETQLREVNGMQVLIQKTELDSQVIKDLAFSWKQKYPNLFLVLGTSLEGKAVLSIAVGDNLVAKGMHAGNLVREWSKHIRGGGGGQPFFATAGGKFPEGLDTVLKLAKEMVG
ncbi:MAG: alanine--tRNA ligase [Cryomorphaceae bacterium]|nr:alanine--tRNA ligase [Cryomorphaceae bacterium]